MRLLNSFHMIDGFIPHRGNQRTAKI